MDDDADQLTTVTMFEEQCAVIAVDGEVDAATCEILTTAVRDAVAAGAQRVVLDLSGVEFMDSSGISALIATRSIAAITLRQPSASVSRLFDVTGLPDVFTIEP